MVIDIFIIFSEKIMRALIGFFREINLDLSYNFLKILLN